MTRLATTIVALVVLVFTLVLPSHAQSPQFRSSKGFACATPCYHLHVVRGTPGGDYLAIPGEWVDVHADLRKMEKGGHFSHWLLRKDVKVASVNLPDTQIQMPVRDADVGWTEFIPGGGDTGK